MGIHYDYKSIRGAKKMQKQQQRDERRRRMRQQLHLDERRRREKSQQKTDESQPLTLDMITDPQRNEN